MTDLLISVSMCTCDSGRVKIQWSYYYLLCDSSDTSLFCWHLHN